MGYGDYLKALLRPMGVYKLDGSVGGSELESVGGALDRYDGKLERLAREMVVLTAEDEGLEAIESLLSHRPVTTSLKRRRAALASLLRIGGDSFTLAAINDNLKGCGLNVLASETGIPEHVEIRFPDVPGIPDGFDEMKQIIEDILPAHLGIAYVFWRITWAIMEARFSTWGDIEVKHFSWDALEKYVVEDE